MNAAYALEHTAASIAGYAAGLAFDAVLKAEARLLKKDTKGQTALATITRSVLAFSLIGGYLTVIILLADRGMTTPWPLSLVVAFLSSVAFGLDTKDALNVARAFLGDRARQASRVLDEEEWDSEERDRRQTR